MNNMLVLVQERIDDKKIPDYDVDGVGYLDAIVEEVLEAVNDE